MFLLVGKVFIHQHIPVMSIYNGLMVGEGHQFRSRWGTLYKYQVFLRTEGRIDGRTDRETYGQIRFLKQTSYYLRNVYMDYVVRNNGKHIRGIGRESVRIVVLLWLMSPVDQKF